MRHGRKPFSAKDVHLGKVVHHQDFVYTSNPEHFGFRILISHRSVVLQFKCEDLLDPFPSVQSMDRILVQHLSGFGILFVLLKGRSKLSSSVGNDDGIK